MQIPDRSRERRASLRLLTCCSSVTSPRSVFLLHLLNTLCAQHPNYIDECFCLSLCCWQFIAGVTRVTATHDGRHAQVKRTIRDQQFAFWEVSNPSLALVSFCQGLFLFVLRVIIPAMNATNTWHSFTADYCSKQHHTRILDSWYKMYGNSYKFRPKHTHPPFSSVHLLCIYTTDISLFFNIENTKR